MLLVATFVSCNGSSSSSGDSALALDQQTELPVVEAGSDLGLDAVADAASDSAVEGGPDAAIDLPPADLPAADDAFDDAADASDLQDGDQGSDGDGDGDSDSDGDSVGDQQLDQGDDAVDQGVDAMTSSWVVSTLAGSDLAGHVDGDASVALFDNPVDVVIEPISGDVLVTDYNNGAIRRVTPAGTVSTLWNLPNDVNPFGLVLAGSYLYVHGEWDSLGNDYLGSLWTVDPSTGAYSLVIDKAGQKRGMAALSDGRIVMTDYEAHILTIYDPVAKSMSPLCGAAGQAAFQDGLAASARFDTPHDVVLTPDGSLIVADTWNHRLRRVQVDGKTSTFAGDGVAESLDGTLATARFNQPTGLAIDNSGVIFVTDAGGHVVRRIAGDSVKTIAGDGTPGYADGPAMQARFFGLEGIAVTADGTIAYITDGNRGESDPYHRLRELSLQPVP